MPRTLSATTTPSLRVMDGHNDTLLALLMPRRGKRRSFFERSTIGHIDLPRAQQANLGAGFFAIFVPNREPEASAPDPMAMGQGSRWPLPQPLGQRYALNVAMQMASLLFRLEAESNGALRVVRSMGDLRAVLAPDARSMGAILHLEGAEPIDRDFVAFDLLVQAGLRSVGIVWSRPTIFGHGVPFAFPASPDEGPGLTDLGRELVRRCNAQRVMIDLSHLNEKGFWDVAALSSAPLVATHSNAHALCASTRNLTDAQIKAIAQSGGVMGINFFAGFLRADGSAKGETSLQEIVRHAAYVANLVGEEHVALGSDMDGVEMPTDFVDVTGMPRLLVALRKAGFDDAGLHKIAQGNWLRVLSATWGE